MIIVVRGEKKMGLSMEVGAILEILHLEINIRN